MRRALASVAFVAFGALLGAACKDKKEAPITVPVPTPRGAASPAPSTRSSGDHNEIQYDPETGRYKTNVKLKGKPEVCARFHACCKASSDTGLFCAMAEINERSCGAALDKVKGYLKERGVAQPAGCR
ncbi:MAG TPA: hypothetical protein VGM56_04795 [Byssovorax sp.]|jgi:hypothetical protein